VGVGLEKTRRPSAAPGCFAHEALGEVSGKWNHAFS
jgi:hypothetical protein